MLVGGHCHVPAAFPRGRPGTLCIVGRVGVRAGVEGAENLTSTGIRNPDRPNLSKSVYRLSYSCPRGLSIQVVDNFNIMACNSVINYACEGVTLNHLQHVRRDSGKMEQKQTKNISILFIIYEFGIILIYFFFSWRYNPHWVLYFTAL